MGVPRDATLEGVDRASADVPADARARGTVAIHEAASEQAAREVAARLLSAGIPAAVEPMRLDAAWVIVPWDRHVDAEVSLRRWGLEVIPRFGSGGDFAASSPSVSRPALGVVPTDAPIERAAPEAEDDDPVEPTLPDSGPLFPRVVVALAAISVGICVQRVVEAVFGAQGAAAAMGARGFELAELWRFVTAGFYHFSLTHLASNLAFGLVFGVVLFGTHGVGATMAAWLFASVVGIGIEVLASPAGVLVAGASAGNYGLVGLWAQGQRDRARRAFLPRREQLRAIGLVLVLAPGALTPVTSSGGKVAVIAHAAGFFGGLLAGLVFARRIAADELPAIDRRARTGQWAAVIAVVIAFAAAARAWFIGAIG